MFSLIVLLLISPLVECQYNDICGLHHGKKFFLEHGESGSVVADFKDNVVESNATSTYSRCKVEFVTCSSCIFEVQFRYLNISRNCGRSPVIDTCGCDYVWIYEPHIEDTSGEQFCGRFLKSNTSELTYVSQTRNIAITFVYNNEYGHAFTLDYFTKRNSVAVTGYPTISNMNNASQYIASAFFPQLYPIDLAVEYIITCESVEPCRISLLFTDFLVDDSSIMEFFDWNGQRMYVMSGNTFRPPVIISNGPSMTIKFYANGGSDYGFKASYSFILGHMDDLAFKPNIGCGGYVNNLGGGITMMNMVEDGTKFYDCVWIIKPPEVYFHRKTHLYVKVATFLDFAGTTELTIRQGLTSTQPYVEVLKYPMAHYISPRQKEHVVPITQGFYVRLRGVFTPQTRLAIVYAAFNYKDCFGGSDFLCENMRCIPVLLNCDGFDHCGDNSDESTNCSQDPKDHREYSKIPNFLFPKIEPYSDITTATFVFLTCSFGLIGVILAMALLLYRVNIRARHQRQIQDHIETIHAILGESVGDIEEEIIVPDDPPDYEPPPDYSELVKIKYYKNLAEAKLQQKRWLQAWKAERRAPLPSPPHFHARSHLQTQPTLPARRCSQCNISKSSDHMRETCSSIDIPTASDVERPSSTANTSCQTMPVRVPDSPPPSYDYLPDAGPTRDQSEEPEPSTSCAPRFILDNLPKYPTHILKELRKGFRNCKALSLVRQSKITTSRSEEDIVKYCSDSELILNSSATLRAWTKCNKIRFKKSFSSDDLDML